MYISHSVMEGQRHNNPLNPRCFCLQRPKTDGTVLAPNPHYSGGRALGDSFKLVMLALRTVRKMTQLPKETQKNGDTNKSKGTNEHAMRKPMLNTQKHTRPNRAVWTGPGSCAHGKLPVYSVNARDHFNCSPLLFAHHETDAAKQKGGGEGQVLTTNSWVQPTAVHSSRQICGRQTATTSI